MRSAKADDDPVTLRPVDRSSKMTVRSGLLLLTLLLPAIVSSAGEPVRTCVHKVRIGGPCADGPRPAFDEVDHSAFDALLHRFVDCEGLVAYGAWRADCAASAALHDYLVSLGGVDTSSETATRPGELAYYINAYNALVIWGILREYPTPSIQSHNRKSAPYRIFDDLELWVDDAYLSLNTIEHERLRTLDEPRIHFALVCAARSCPRLRNEAYTPDRLEEQLVDNALDFFSRPDRFRACRLTGHVKLSSILDWFGADFGKSDQELLLTIGPYLPDRDRDWVLAQCCPKLKFVGYNWGLNDRCPTASVIAGRVPYRLFAAVQPTIRLFKPSSKEGAGEDADTADDLHVDAPPPPRSLEPIEPLQETSDHGGDRAAETDRRL